MDQFIKKLQLNSLIVTDAKDLKQKLKNKHWTRYQTCLYFLNSNKLPTKQGNMYAFYRADIVIRRMIYEKLCALEEGLKTSIIYEIENRGWTFKKSNKFSFNFDNWKNDTKSFRYNNTRAKKFLLKTLNKFYKKGIREWKDAIWEMQLGQVKAFLQVVDNDIFKIIIKNFNDKLILLSKPDIIKQLDLARRIRNNISHIKMLFEKFLFWKDKTIKLKDVISALDILSPKMFLKILKQDIDIYEYKCKKHANTKQYYNLPQTEIEAMFQKIKEVLNV